MKKNIIGKISLSVILIMLPAFLYCQSRSKCEDYLISLPKQLQVSETTPQKYLMTTDYMDYDLFGNFIKKNRVTGECTLLKDGYVKWNNVKISGSQNPDEPFPDGEKQSFMENFTYNPSSGVLNDSFFKDVPKADIFIKNLVWDLTMFETYAWYKWDSLRLNSEFPAKDINSEIKIPGAGTFENRDVRITWAGITKTNDKICAIIKYIALNNSLEMKYQNATIKGRSHYWGSINVSLSDRQIEYAGLYEDVLLDIKTEGQISDYKSNTVRNISLIKIQ